MAKRKTSFFTSCIGIFQGGGCRAAAYAGAYEELHRYGVTFSAVSGTSAGSIVAALIGAGATPKEVIQLIHELDFKSFMVPPRHGNGGFALSAALRAVPAPTAWKAARIVRFQGLHSTDHLRDWMEARLRGILKLDASRTVRFSDLMIPTSVIATDLVDGQVKAWTTDDDGDFSVASAVAASCAIPFFFQPVNDRYVDGGVLSNLPLFSSRKHGGANVTERVLAFTLVAETKSVPLPLDTPNLARCLLTTITDGAQRLQEDTHADAHIIRIPTGAIMATDFDKMDAHAVTTLVESGRKAVDAYLSHELSHARGARRGNNLLRGAHQRYLTLQESLRRAVNVITIVSDNSRFVWDLFPTLAHWRLKGVRVRVVIGRGDDSQHGPYRRRLLRGLGVDVTETAEALPHPLCLVEGEDSTDALAIVGLPHGQRATDVVYTGAYDGAAIDAIRDRVQALFPPATSQAFVPRIAKGKVEDVVDAMRRVKQYSGERTSISVERVKLSQLRSLCRTVHGYKLVQIQLLIEALETAGVGLFDPAFMTLDRGERTLITPPVVEQSGDEFVLIEGSTRAVFLRDSGVEDMTCVVVRHPNAELPAKPYEFRRVRVVNAELNTKDRYESFDFTLFRQIERAAHPPSSLEALKTR